MNEGKIAGKNANRQDAGSSDAYHKAHTELLEMVVEAKPLIEIFEKTALLIESISPVKTWCALKLVSQSDLSLQLVAAPSIPESIIEEIKNLNISPDEGTCGQAVKRRETVISEDIANDPNNRTYHEIARKSGIKSCWSVPVIDRDGLPLAVLTSFYHTHHKPSALKIKRIEEMCRLICLAIERQQASDELIRSNDKFKSAAAATNDAVWDWDIAADTLWWNDGFSTLFGFDGEGSGPTLNDWAERIHPEDRDRIVNSLSDCALGSNKHWDSEYRFLRKNGEYAYVLDQAEVIFGSDGKAVRMIGGMSDVTSHRKAEHELKALNRAFELLSSCNQTLIRATDEQRMLTDICEIATKVGGYRMAWVGFADNDPEKSIVPAATAGKHAEYPYVISLSHNEHSKVGQGPGGRAIRSGKPVICEDIANAESNFVWMKEALERGFKSLVCLPLNEGENCFGFLSLLSGEINAIGRDEEKLLQELADNLAYGILSLRSRAKQKTTQDTVVRVAQTISTSFGKKFYELLTKNMVETLSASAGLIGKINPEEDSVTTLAMVLDGNIQENVTYSLDGTPCKQVTSKQACVFENNLPELFPEDHYLINLGIQAYAGIALYNTKEEPVGVLSVLFREPLRDPSIVTSILQIFAERAASEMAREESDAQIFEQASLLDKARDAIFTFDLQNRISYWNKSAARLYGFSSSEATQKSALELLHENPEGHERAFEATLENGQWLGELHQIDRQGKPLIVESRWNLVRDSQGNPKSILAINTNITEHKNLEQQFLRAQRLESIGTLAGGLAHDLNNVLAPIPMSVELLRKNIEDDRGNELLATIDSSSRRAAEMIRQILSFARGVEGRRLVVSAEEIISELAKIIQDTFPKCIQIESGIEEELWPVKGDSTQLHQVLLNLCVNARDAMPEGGSLRIFAKNENIDENYAANNLEACAGPYICIDVADTGHGIAPDILGRIYDPFFTTKDTGKGTGLGLSTTLAIVRSHGGFIKSSSKVNKGTIFQIYLPAFPAETTQHLPAESKISAKPPRGNGQTILLIDDEPAILEVTRRTLLEFGYKPVTTNSGIEAIAYFRENHTNTDAVISDMMMPGLDGSQTINALLEIDPDARVIAVSGFRTNRDLAENSGSKVRHFLRKPFTAKEILTGLEDLLKR